MQSIVNIQINKEDNEDLLNDVDMLNSDNIEINFEILFKKIKDSKYCREYLE